MGFLDSLFKSKSNTVTQEEMLTPQQKQAQDLLYNYGAYGTLPGGFTAGTAYGGSMGDYNVSPLEQAGQNRLMDLFGGGGDINTSRGILTKMGTEDFNLDDPSNQWAAFKRMAERQQDTGASALDREAAIQGNRYGTAILQNKRDLGERTNDLLLSRLSELFDNAQGRKMQAASGLAGLAGAEQNLVSQAMQAGALQRMLNTKKAQDAYNEWLRQREERLNSIKGVEDVWGRGVDYGVKSITSTTPSMFSQLLSPALSAAGIAMGWPAGAAIGGGIKSIFSKPDAYGDSLLEDVYGMGFDY